MEHEEMTAGGGRSSWFLGGLAVAVAFAGLLYYDGFFASKVDIALKANTPPVIIEGN